MKDLYILIIVLILVGKGRLLQAKPSSFLNPDENLESQANEILREMVFLFGSSHLHQKPTIHITPTVNYGARFINGRIEIEQSILDICRSLGSDSTNALAFVIGHELTHYFQNKQDSSVKQEAFLSFFDGFSSEKRIEREADLQGSFMSYLAGFSPQTVLPAFLTELYRKYRIDESKLNNYPSLQERRKSFEAMLNSLEKMIELHRSCMYLSILGKHYLSTVGYTYLLKFYQGVEIFNNLGLNQLLQALNYGKYIYDPALYPVEIDLNTRLKKPISRAPQILDEFRKKLLMEALVNFSKAIERSEKDFSFHLNKLCVLILLQDYGEAMNELVTVQDLQLSNKERERLQIMEALLYIKEGKQNVHSGRDILKQLSNSSNEFIKRIAIHNYNVFVREQISSIQQSRPARNTGSFSTPREIEQLDKKESISPKVKWSYLKDKEETYYSFDNGIEEMILLISEAPGNVSVELISSLNEMNIIFSSEETLFYRLPESERFYGIQNGKLKLSGILMKR